MPLPLLEQSDREPGFLYDGDELTNARWLDMLEILSRRWREYGSQQRDPFEIAKRAQSWQPGILEHLRRLVLASQWEATELRRHTLPAWLGQSLIELAGSWGSPFRGGTSNLPSLIAHIITNSREIEAIAKPRIYCAYDLAADVAIEFAASGMTVDFDLQSETLAAICQCISFAENFTLRVRCGDPMNLARTDQETHGTGHRPSYDIAIVIPPFNDKSRARDADTLGTGLPRPANSEAVGVTVALARGRELAICVVSPSFLFQASKSNQVFKEYAIADYCLDSVVSFSSTLLQTLSNSGRIASFQALERARAQFVRRTIYFYGRSSRGTWPLRRRVGQHSRRRQDDPRTRDHPEYGSCQRSRHSRQRLCHPTRALLESLEAERLRRLEASSNFVPLEELVEFVRPQAVRKPQDEELGRR